MTYQPHPQQQAIRALHDANGALTPALFVETARQPSHELHRLFDWEYDEPQLRARARNLIRAQRVVHSDWDRDHLIPEYTAVHNPELGLRYVATTVLRAGTIAGARSAMAEES